MQTLTPDLAERFAGIALGHVTREYPNKLDHVLSGPPDAQTPAALHPVFYGSFDWHSCVHAYWMLGRILSKFPQLPITTQITSLFDRQLTPEKVAAECAYLERSGTRGFERPYGWAWLLKLAAELQGGPWAAPIAPLADAFAARFRGFLPIATYPMRVGTHANTAFALRLAADYPDPELSALLHAAALRWYGNDTACPAWGEPSLDEFLSPALIEAMCMRRLLPPQTFSIWFTKFLPQLHDGFPTTLFQPAIVSDRSDGKIAHLDGLNLSRAWCMRSLASALSSEDERRGKLLHAAEQHLSAAVPHIAGDYMGEHWLATFAVLALEV